MYTETGGSMAESIDLTGMNIPNHIAIIMDGNGRWAKKRFLPRNAGHVAGAKTVEKIIEDAYDLGVKYLTVYAFSTENWNRPDDEVAALMKLLKNYLKDCIKRANSNNMRVRVIGERSRLEPEIVEKIEELEECSKNNTGITFIIALNYGARDEMIRGMKKMWQDGISAEEITEEKYASYLDTKDIPDPDLMIRTSGEQRLSNFLLWQFAYSELYFTEVPWPDFTPEELRKAVEDYSGRDRRYGKIEEE